MGKIRMCPICNKHGQIIKDDNFCSQELFSKENAYFMVKQGILHRAMSEAEAIETREAIKKSALPDEKEVLNFTKAQFQAWNYDLRMADGTQTNYEEFHKFISSHNS